MTIKREMPPTQAADSRTFGGYIEVDGAPLSVDLFFNADSVALMVDSTVIAEWPPDEVEITPEPAGRFRIEAGGDSVEFDPVDSGGFGDFLIGAPAVAGNGVVASAPAAQVGDISPIPEDLDGSDAADLEDLTEVEPDIARSVGAVDEPLEQQPANPDFLGVPGSFDDPTDEPADFGVSSDVDPYFAAGLAGPEEALALAPSVTIRLAKPDGDIQEFSLAPREAVSAPPKPAAVEDHPASTRFHLASSPPAPPLTDAPSSDEAPIDETDVASFSWHDDAQIQPEAEIADLSKPDDDAVVADAPAEIDTSEHEADAEAFPWRGTEPEPEVTDEPNRVDLSEAEEDAPIEETPLPSATPIDASAPSGGNHADNEDGRSDLKASGESALTGQHLNTAVPEPRPWSTTNQQAGTLDSPVPPEPTAADTSPDAAESDDDTPRSLFGRFVGSARPKQSRVAADEVDETTEEAEAEVVVPSPEASTPVATPVAPEPIRSSPEYSGGGLADRLDAIRQQEAEEQETHTKIVAELNEDEDSSRSWKLLAGVATGVVVLLAGVIWGILTLIGPGDDPDAAADPDSTAVPSDDAPAPTVAPASTIQPTTTASPETTIPSDVIPPANPEAVNGIDAPRFVESWNEIAGTYSEALTIAGSSLPLDVPLSSSIRLAYDAGGTLTISATPQGNEGDRDILVVLGAAVAWAEPDIGGDARKGVLAAVGIDVDNPQLMDMNGSNERAGLRYNASVVDDRELVFTISPAG